MLLTGGRRPCVPSGWIYPAVMLAAFAATSLGAGADPDPAGDTRPATVATVAAAGPGSVAPPVLRAFADPASDRLDDDGRQAVWVWFRARGRDEAARRRALADAASELDPRSLSRRVRAAAARGGAIVGESDLPLDAAHLAAVAATGAELRRRSRWLNAASFDMTESQVRAAAALPQVLRITPVGLARRHPVPESDRIPASPGRSDRLPANLDYGNSLPYLAQVNVPALHSLGLTGHGVRMGFLDTGFRMAHESLDHLTVFDAWDFINDDPEVDNEPGDDAAQHNHGTMVVSFACGLTPGVLVGPAHAAEVVLAKTERVNEEIPSEEDAWVAGLEWIESRGCDLASSSLGWFDWLTYQDLDGDTTPSAIAADAAAARGLLVFVAAGNQRQTAFPYLITPADADSVITVGAVRLDGGVTSFSSPGPTADGRIKPDVCAPGQDVFLADPADDDGYLHASGTSFSTPLTAGVAALLLERLPTLTPIQVRDALRASGDHAAAPDNDYGWGVIDALAALNHFIPSIVHAPHPDSEDPVGPYTVAAEVSSRLGLDPASPTLKWRADGGLWQTAAMSLAGGDVFAADVPGQPVGAVVDYYIAADDVLGNQARLPADAPDAVFTFRIGPDVQAPVIAHSPLWDHPRFLWPPVVSAAVSDNLGVAAVTVSYSVDGLSCAPFALAPAGGADYAAPLPFDVEDLHRDSEIVYTLHAVDAAAAGNAAADGPHVFHAIEKRGDVLVVDDGGVRDSELGRWLEAAGYEIRRVTAAALAAEDLTDVHFVALAAGDNPFPADVPAARYHLEQWVDRGGRLLAEGGHLARYLLQSGLTMVWAQSILHCFVWLSDDAAPLGTTAAGLGHPLLTLPHALPDTLAVRDDVGEYAFDLVSPMPGASALLSPDGLGGSLLAAGEDAAAWETRLALFTFDLRALADTADARRLVENAAVWLMDSGELTDAGPPSAWATALGPVVPNPFNPRTEIRFTLTADARPVLDVFDLRGRRVVRLVDHSPLPAGPHAVTWDGTDSRGRPVAGGGYLCRLEAEGKVVSRKLLLAR